MRVMFLMVKLGKVSQLFSFDFVFNMHIVDTVV